MVVYEVKKMRKFDIYGFHSWQYMLSSALHKEDLMAGKYFETSIFIDSSTLVHYLVEDFLKRRNLGLKKGEASINYFDFHIFNFDESSVARIDVAKDDFYRQPQIQTRAFEVSEFDSMILGVLRDLSEKNIPGVLIK